jgi:hypothetical protein
MQLIGMVNLSWSTKALGLITANIAFTWLFWLLGNIFPTSCKQFLAEVHTSFQRLNTLDPSNPRLSPHHALRDHKATFLYEWQPLDFLPTFIIYFI